MPECADDFLRWRPLSYREHFMASNFRARELAIEAYETADADIRTEFDNITSAMTSILTAVSAAMREVQPGQDPRDTRRAGHRLGEAAGRAGRRHHQWRLRSRRRYHHGKRVSAVATPVPPPHPQLAVSGAIFRDDRILLVRRAGSPAKGFDPLPGGRVEFGELLHAALHREVDEETGLDDRHRRARRMARGAAGKLGGGHYLIMSFAARWIGREPVLNDELDDFKWLAPGAFGDLKLTGGLEEVVAAAWRLIRS